MTLLEIFEKVNLVMPLEQRRFFNHFNDTVCELISLYGDSVLAAKGEYTPPKTLSDDVGVLPIYPNAIVDNILFLAGGEDLLKNECLRKSELAHLKYWNDNAKGRRMRRMRW